MNPWPTPSSSALRVRAMKLPRPWCVRGRADLQCCLFADRHAPALRRRRSRTRFARASPRHCASGAQSARRCRSDLRNDRRHRRHSGAGPCRSIAGGAQLCEGLSFALEQAINRGEPSRRAYSCCASRGSGRTETTTCSFRFSRWSSAAGTHIFISRSDSDAGWTYRNIGHTRDDAAGEAFDKVAKLLELGYPGGPIIDFLAQHGNPNAVKFPFAQIKHRDRNPQNRHAADELPDRLFVQRNQDSCPALCRTPQHGRQHSSAVASRSNRSPSLRQQDYLAACDRQTLDLVASFQRAIVDDLVSKTLSAAVDYGVATLLVTGGVAANSELRTTFETRAAEEGIPVLLPFAQAFD